MSKSDVQVGNQFSVCIEASKGLEVHMLVWSLVIKYG